MPGFFQLKMKRHGNMITHYSEAGGKIVVVARLCPGWFLVLLLQVFLFCYFPTWNKNVSEMQEASKQKMWWPCIVSRSRKELEYVCKAFVGPATRQQTQPGKNLWTNTNTIPLTFQNGPAARRWNGNVKIGCNLGWDDARVGPVNVCMLDLLHEWYRRLWWAVTETISQKEAVWEHILV